MRRDEARPTDAPARAGPRFQSGRRRFRASLSADRIHSAASPDFCSVEFQKKLAHGKKTDDETTRSIARRKPPPAKRRAAENRSMKTRPAARTRSRTSTLCAAN